MKNDKQRAQYWKTLQSLGLWPDVDSLETYEKRVYKGLQQAREHLKDLRAHGQINPSPDLVSTLHRHVFGAVFPWAREFRQPDLAQGQTVEAGVPGIDKYAHWQNISDGLKSIQHENVGLLFGKDGKQTTEEQKAEAIALYRHGFERVCPFTIGNKPIVDLIIDELALQSFKNVKERGISISQNLDNQAFRDALGEFDQKHNIAPLRDQILGAAGAADNHMLKQADRDINQGLDELKLRQEIHATKHQSSQGSQHESGPNGGSADGRSHDNDHGHDH